MSPREPEPTKLHDMQHSYQVESVYLVSGQTVPVYPRRLSMCKTKLLQITPRGAYADPLRFEYDPSLVGVFRE